MRGANDEIDHDLRHKELRHHEEGTRLARRLRRELRIPRLQDRGRAQGKAQSLVRRTWMGNPAQSGRDDVSEITRGGQSGLERTKSAGADAGTAVDDQA